MKQTDNLEFVGISSKLLRIFWKTEGVDYYMIFKASNGAEIIEINKVDELDALNIYPEINHALVVVKIDDDYLLGYHKWRDDWETFGGLLEKGENLRECIERETEEELGLTGIQYEYLGVVHYYMPPSYWVKEWHEEYGGLYGIKVSKATIEIIEEKRKDKDEIGEVALVSALKAQGAKIDEINEALLKLFQ